MSLDAVLEAIGADPLLGFDFAALCDAGGRLAGSASATSAFTFAALRMSTIGPLRNESSAYAGWTCHEARIETPDGREIPCTPLLGTLPCRALVLDLRDAGRGAPGQYQDVAGRCAMTRHEYPFATHTLHRRAKLAAAQEAGAAAFLIVQPEPGAGPVSGSSGRAGGHGIPALGIAAEGAALLREAGRLRITIEAEDHPAETPNLIVELPGRGRHFVVLSAHLDGHPLGESAIDNASGVAAALAIARAMAPLVEHCEYGLMLCVFGAEEWAPAGSRAWLAAQPAGRRARMALNINLDSIVGSARLTALTGGFASLPPLLRGALPALGIHEPLTANGDHADFAALGVPAARILAGFDEPDSRLKYLLTAADRRRLVPDAELRMATLACARLVWAALHAPGLIRTAPA